MNEDFIQMLRTGVATKYDITRAGDMLRTLSDKIKTANARERKAFMYALKIDPDGWMRNDDGVLNEEQEWQQYRCKDDSDWNTVSDVDAAEIEKKAAP